MFSLKILNKVKNSALLYGIYYYVGCFLVNVLKLFLRSDNNLILFVSYGGRQYDDTPKDVFEAMMQDCRFAKYKKVWAFRNPELFNVSPAKKIKIDTFQYYRTALKSRVWITNVGITRALNFTGIHTLSVNSWHGTAIKYIGKDAIRDNMFVGKGNSKMADVMLAQGNYDQNIFSRAFNLNKKDIVLTGFPRNDTLVVGNNQNYIEKLKKKMRIPLDKKVVLYAPTYRDYDLSDDGQCVMKPPIDLRKWEAEMSDKYVLIIKAHVAVMKMMDVKENDFVKDFSNYPILNDILLVSDILISDYSGILFDYSILGRPIVCYTYDYEKYSQMRGMYFDIRNELSYANDENALLSLIKNMNWLEEKEKTVKFRDRYVQKYGNSSNRVLDLLYDRLSRVN